ncbi:MAG: ACT domain-containing protein [Planctomycetaceae bacterium]
MRKEFVLTITAANRIGILAAVSNGIAELSGDIRELNVSVMSRFFSIIVAADFPDDRQPGVIGDHLRDIGRPYGLEVVIKDPAREQLQNDPGEDAETLYMTLTGRDQPGMMRRIASRLAQDGIDISDVYATRNGDTGDFQMILEFVAPGGTDRAELLTGMQQLHEDAGIRAQLQTAADLLTAGITPPLRALL